MTKKDKEFWADLWSAVEELSTSFPEGIVFIGGIAVYLHVKNGGLPEEFIEFSHDGDFYIDSADMSELQQEYEVVNNARLRKKQFLKNDIEFDVYVEHQHGLAVTYEDLSAGSVILSGVRTACLEHLLILKLYAYRDRRGAKRQKDERDLIRIVHLLNQDGPSPSLLSRYLTPQLAGLFKKVSVSQEFRKLCNRNDFQAAKLRDSFARGAAQILWAVR